MTTSTSASRHVPIVFVESYIARNLHGIVSIEGDPIARLVIDAPGSLLSLQVPAEETEPDVHAFEHLSFDVVHEDHQTWHQLTVRVDGNLDEVYGLICVIADRVQLSHEGFAQAVQASLESMAGLLATRRGLSRETQIGLFGELLVLLAIAKTPDAPKPVSTWLGPMREEHDFGYGDFDLEVKTTQGEKRHHWISSPTQLTPTPGRALYLVSIQVTLAAMGEGQTLPQLVALTRERVADEVVQLDAALASVGYRDADAELYHSNWVPRSEPVFFEVTSAFPALTAEAISKGVPSSERIIDLRYLIDLTGMDPSPALLEFGGVVEWKNSQW
jgi:Putative  PD-(D/E)XK family member, (DUF4420)